MNHAGVRALLDDSRDDISVFPAVFTEDSVIANVAQALIDDLLCGVCSDSPKIFGAIHFLASFLALLVEDGDENGDVAVFAVQFHAGARSMGVTELAAVVSNPRVLLIRGQNGLLDDHDELVKRDFTLRLHELEHTQVDIHERPSCSVI